MDIQNSGMSGPEPTERKETGAVSRSTSTASINIASYPYILSHIIAASPPRTQAILLRCSKSMFRAASAVLYRDFRLDMAQFNAMIGTGWTSSALPSASSSTDNGKSFSTTLRQALQCVKTLHLPYHPDVDDFPDIPLDCFQPLSSTVLFVTSGWSLRSNIKFPAAIVSLGSHLYLRISDDEIRRVTDSRDISPIITFDCIPPSLNAITILIPLACRLSTLPTVKLLPAPTAPSPKVTMVFLPWTAVSDEDREYQATMLKRWSEVYQLFAPSAVTHVVGAECSGPKENLKPVLGRELPDHAKMTEPSFEPFDAWSTALKDDSIFSTEEHLKLVISRFRMISDGMNERVHDFERNLERLRAHEDISPELQAEVEDMEREVELTRQDTQGVAAFVLKIEAMAAGGS